MKSRRAHRFLHVAAAVVTVAICVAVCSYLLLVTNRFGGNIPFLSQIKNAMGRSDNAVSYAGSVKDRELVLVNLSHKMPDWYAPQLVNELGVQTDSSIVQPYRKMKSAASKDGISLWISSSYRSNQTQTRLFQQEVDEYSKKYPSREEAVTAAAKSVAKPGYSEHETGLAMDLNGVKDDFDQSDAFRWLNQHAQDYGFILRYPKDKQSVTMIKYEPWHFRYVGVENAKAMKNEGLCLEEYFEKKQ